MDSPIRILYIDDSPFDRGLVRHALTHENSGFELTEAASRADFETALAAGSFDLILSDFNILGFNGLQVLEIVQAKDSNIPVIIVTGTGSEEIAVKALKHGAADYVIKTTSHIQRLPLTIQAALEKKRAEETQREIEQQYRTVFETTPIGIGVADMQGNLLVFNDAMLLPGGYTREDMKKIGDVTSLYYDPNQRNEALALLKKQGFLRNHPVQFKRKDGTLYDALLSLTPVVFQGKPCIQALTEDVTERKQAQDALRESEQKFRLLAENARDLIYRYRLAPTRGFEYVSPAATLLTGYTPEEHYADPNLGFKLVHPDDQHLLEEGALRENHPDKSLILRWVSKDGSIIWTEQRNTPIFDDAGNLVAIEGIARDITERKHAEAALRESEDRYRDLVENSNDLIGTHDLQGNLLSMNETTMRLTGYSRQDLLRMNLADLLIPPIRRLLHTYLKRVQTRGRARGIMQIQTANGETRYWEYDNTLRAEGVAAPVVRAVARDITERKRAEDALRQNEEKYRNLIDAMSEGLGVQDNNGFITFMNRRGCEMLGYELEELIGKHVFFLFDEENQRILREQMALRWEGLQKSYEIAWLRKDGGKIETIIAPRPRFDEKGELVESVAVFTDITERKLAEEQLHQRLGELEVLYQSGLALIQLLDPRAIAAKIIGLLDQQMDWHHTAIRLYHPENETLELLAFNIAGLKTAADPVALEERFKTSVARADQGLSGWVIQGGHALRSNDLKNDPRYIQTFPGLQSGLYVPIKIAERVIGVISIESERANAFSESDERLTITLAAQAAIAIDNAQLLDGLQQSNRSLAQAYDATIEGWSRAMDLRDKETEGHTLRVTEKTLELARVMGISESQLTQIRRGALLHDMGKLGVPDSILLKPGELTHEEWQIMRNHPTYAYEMLSSIQYLKPALDIPYCHHEKWDGTGYPRGLKDEQIPLVARIFAVVDVWDALRSDRPYRAAWTDEKVYEHLRSLAGTHFDPNVVKAFLEMTHQG